MFTWNYLQSKSFWKVLARNFYIAFTALWLFFGVIGVFWKDGLVYGFRAYGSFLLASLLLALLFSRRPNSVSRKLSASDTAITNKIGDLFAQEGVIVIGVSDTFDTMLGDVISPKSVQGQFQSRFFPDPKRLDNSIKRELEKIAVSERDTDKKIGKQNRYPIGTTIMVESEGKRFFLVAYTKMLAELRTDSDICMLASSLDKCWSAIRDRGQNLPVHVGIVGSRFARIGLSRALLVQFIVLSFIDAERKKHVTPHLTIYVYEGDAEEINFHDLRQWLQGLTRVA